MNAIVGLCHFCEAHGPRPVFCTFTTENEKHTTESSNSTLQCNGCTSLGPETVLVSKDDELTIFCSRETVPNTEVTAFLRQAAIRSITCEVSWNNESGIFYFSDVHVHVLSFTFQMKDTRARGLKRWFSIVVLMKDKMLLLNLADVLSEHMKQIAKELQELANAVFDNEQKICSQRALRLKTEKNDFGQSRSLVQLTGDEDVFKRLHSQFTWMLKTGAHTYVETLYSSKDLLHKLNPMAVKGSIFDGNACSVLSDEDSMPLRDLKRLLSKDVFRVLMYCTLSGIMIYLSDTCKDREPIYKGLLRLLPVITKNPPKLKIQGSHVLPPAYSCVLRELENGSFSCVWPGSLPAKCPTIMNRIEAAMTNEKINDAVLHQQVKSLQLEWLGTARAVKAAIVSSGAASESVATLKKMLGVTQYDEQLLHYWMAAYCE